MKGFIYQWYKYKEMVGLPWKLKNKDGGKTKYIFEWSPCVRYFRIFLAH